MSFTIYCAAKEKQYIRDLVAFTAATNNATKILSLSAETFASEMAMIDANPNCTIDCVDYGTTTFLSAKKNLKKLDEKYTSRINLRLENIFNIDFAGYDFVFLDLCGVITDKLIPNIITATAGFNGDLFLTLTKGRDGGLKESYGLKKEEIQHFRTTTFPNLLNKFANLKQIGGITEYSNKSVNTMAVTMMLYHFTKK